MFPFSRRVLNKGTTGTIFYHNWSDAVLIGDRIRDLPYIEASMMYSKVSC